MNEQQTQALWSEYYKATSTRQPRDLLVGTLAKFGDFAGFAIDLGCGAGIETAALLRRGWRVLAIDSQPEALAWTRTKAPLEQKARLETELAPFTQVRLPPADLVWAGLSLPFCPPTHFDKLWTEIVTSVRAGGRFAGDFFGPNHAWAGDDQMTFHSKDQLVKLLQPFASESLTEEEGERPTACLGIQHWHGFAVIARKP
jgi:SAM-dependent methyltransferase